MENKSIMKSTYIFAGLFLLMAAYFTYYLGFKSQDQMNNSYNKLTDKLSESIERGKIYSSDGTVLAETKVDDEGEEYRYYPFNDVFCHVVGSTVKGKYGIEALYNYQLLSSDVSWITKVLNDMQGEKYSGNNVVTTLNVDLQQAAYNAMKEYTGAVVVMEADTGKVLTMMSNPAYNPNEAADNWDTISSDEKSPILNRATMGLYTPGSIFKLFTLEEYLEEGRPLDISFYCSSSLEIEGHKVSCANGIWHGTVDLKGAFSNSCNGAFINIGDSLDEDGLSKLCDRLLFNSSLPISFPYSKSSFNLRSDASEFLKSQTYFGQGETLVTPFHMALICSSIANDGVLMKPLFVDSIQNTYGSTVETFKSEEYAELFTPQQAETLKTYMRNVVESGTAVRLNQFENLTAYGKTGTAEVEDGSLANSWFIGFVEKGDKSYAIAVVCEKVNANISPAVVVARDILKVLD